MKFDSNGKKTVYHIDVDGTLTNGELFWETEPTPNLAMVEAVKKLYGAGNIIIIHTARQWNCAPETVGWLIKYQVPFHGIYMAKGGSGCYVDDKGMSISDLLKYADTLV